MFSETREQRGKTHILDTHTSGGKRGPEAQTTLTLGPLDRRRFQQVRMGEACLYKVHCTELESFAPAPTGEWCPVEGLCTAIEAGDIARWKRAREARVPRAEERREEEERERCSVRLSLGESAGWHMAEEVILSRWLDSGGGFQGSLPPTPKGGETRFISGRGGRTLPLRGDGHLFSS